jgi:hypothetical protein
VTNAGYSASGHILFARDGSVHSVPFDERRVAITGPEQKLLDGVTTQPNGAAQFSVASNGALAYLARSQVAQQQELVWMGRQGNTEVLFDAREVFLMGAWDFRHEYAGAEISGDIVSLHGVARGTLTAPGADPSPVANNFMLAFKKQPAGQYRFWRVAFAPAGG